MKKYFLSIVALAGMLFATSCQESLVEPQVEGPTTFTVQVPDAMGTKAAIGSKENVNQLLVAVYSEATGDAVALTRATATSASGQFKVQFNLLQDQSYDIVFWAQVENEYVNATANDFDLRSITMKNDNHNNEDGAAFFAYVADFVPTGSAQSVTLKRPFAQLNLGTTGESLNPATGEVFLVSSEIKIKGLAQRFNTITGMGENPTTEEVTYFAEIPTGWQPLSAAGSTYEYVSMDYLPIVGDDKAVFDIEANIVVKDEAGAPKTTIKHKFTSVPVQENYRTNIVGNLISSTSDFVVSIDDGFVDENGNLNPDNDYLVVDNVYAAEVAFNNGETHVAINNIGNTQILKLPNNGKELYLQLPDSDGQITIKRDAGNFNISVPDTNPSNTGLTIIIDAPNSTVGFTGQALVINSTTASNTLNLSDANVGTIIVEKGNVILQDETEVGTVLKGEDAVGDITIYVENGAIVAEVDNNLNKVEESEEDSDMSLIITVAKFRKFAQLVNEGTSFSGKTILLLADLDLNNEEWTPIGNSSNRFKGTFDGNNHTISNLVVEGGSSSDQGLFGFTADGEIKNLIVNNAKVSGRLNVGVVAGTPYTSKYTNIIVTGHVEVNGMAYVGGVAGKNAYANWEDILVEVDETSYVKANSVENGTVYRTYVGGVVGFNGEGGHSFTDITSNIDVKGSTCDVGGLFGIAHYGNNFVNCSSSGDVEIYAAEDIDSAEEIGGIAGVWNNHTDYQVTFTDCLFTGNLRTNVENVDLTDNLIVGAAYSSTGNGKLIIGDDVIRDVIRTVSTADELVAALEAKENVLFLNDIKIEPASMSNAYGTTGINVKYGQTINGNGYTLNIKGAGGTWDSGINTTGGLIKNITVTGSFRGIFINHTSEYSEKVILENVTIGGNGTVYTISCDKGLYQGIEATNCTFNGWTSFAKTAGEAKFVNCKFGEGSGYKYCRPYSKTEFVNCTFCPGYTVDKSQAEVTFTDCTFEE